MLVRDVTLEISEPSCSPSPLAVRKIKKTNTHQTRLIRLYLHRLHSSRTMPSTDKKKSHTHSHSQKKKQKTDSKKK